MAWRSLLPGRNKTMGPPGGGPPPPDEALPSPPSVFGKLPDRPDFVRLGGSSVGFERWVEEGLELVVGKGGAFVSTPVRFLVSADDAGIAWSGVMVASADAVGRVFPVALFRAVAGTGAGGLFTRWQEQQRFFAHAEAALLRRPTSESLAGVLAAWDDEAPLPDVPSSADHRGEVGPADAALAAEMDDVAALAAKALAELAREETPAAAPRSRTDEDTAPLPVLPGLSDQAADHPGGPRAGVSDRLGAVPLGAATLAARPSSLVADVTGAAVPMTQTTHAAQTLATSPLPAIEVRPRELTPPFIPHPAPVAGERAKSSTPLSPELLASTPAQAAFERAFGPPAAWEYALSTFLAACDAARGPGRKSITVEAPALDVGLAAFFIALASRRLAAATVGPSLLVQPDRLVFELVEGPATPSLLAATCLGIKAGPRHWTLRNDAGAAAALPPAIKAVLQSPGTTLLALLEAVP